ncbi:alpha/beta hydrolase [Aliikangiella sp. IMCC44653]
MLRYFLLLVKILCCQSLLAKELPKIALQTTFSIGETIQFHSNILSEDRKLNIYLPHGYSQNTSKNYPVIYLLDGSADEDFIHIAGLVQFGSFSWINQVPESIVVGIANVDRKRDFTYPSKNTLDLKELPTSGGSAQFISAISQEIQPLISKNYRTTSTKTIIGQSLGGLLAAEILFQSPELFDHYIIISPSLWWDDESLLKRNLSFSAATKSVYVGVGKEGAVMERLAKALFTKLQAVETKQPALHFNFFEQLSHGDTMHLAVYDAFDKIFKSKNQDKAN